MTTTTFVIVPALTEQAGQCGIVCREHDETHSDGRRMTLGLADYRRKPELWKLAGVMNSSGRLVCLESTPAQWADIKSCEPLMAGSVFTYRQEQAS